MMDGLTAYPRILPLLLAFLFVGLAMVTPAASTSGEGGPPQCRPDGQVAAIPELPEASGIAVSRRVPGRLWAHNDSGQPILFALDTRGSVSGRVRLSGVALEDWEAVVVGPCPGGSCVYVADIGDNAASRKRIAVYRFPEPEGSEASVAVTDVFHATYPDGAHDAEALLVTPDGGLFIVTKGDSGAIALYRFPKDSRAGTTHSLERVGGPQGSGKPDRNERITDGAVSTTGEWIVLRSRQKLMFLRTSDVLAGNWQVAKTIDLTAIGEPQGEGVAIDGDTVYLIGEGGGRSRAGTFARLNCSTNS